MIKRNPDCDRCKLCETAEYVCLLGDGPKKSKVMILGEAPGKREDNDGVPFVGRSGKLLDRLLDEIDLPREDVYITNAVHCRPPENRTPKTSEINACKYWLQKEIKSVKPKFIITLGNIPLQALTGKKGIKRARGKPIEEDDYLILPTYHPSYALRDPRQEEVIEQDLKYFKKIIDQGGPRLATGSNCKVVDTGYKDEIDEALRCIAEVNVVALDTETSGLEPHQPGSWVTSIGINDGDTQWCFPLNHRLSPIYENFTAQRRVVKRIAKAISGKVIVAQNGKFDSKWLAVIYGIMIRCTFDTMLAHYNLDENSKHALDYLAMKYFGAINYEIPLTDKFGITGTLEKHCEYLALDIFYTLKLYHLFMKEFKEDKQAYKIFKHFTMPAVHFYTDVEMRGVYVNPKKLRQAKIYWTKERDKALSKLDKLVPDDRKWKDKKTKEWRTGINWASPLQVAEVLFDRLDLNPLDETPTGKASTSESVLLRLNHRIPRLILKARGAEKNLNTFILPWIRQAVNNRIYPSFKLHGTVTGRPSCEDPNLQQTPRDPRIRNIIDAPPGYKLVSCDLSQIELRLIADASQDPQMMRTYREGGDIHTLTVQTIFGIMKPDKETRKRGKAINFGFCYGMYEKKFLLYARDTFGVSFNMGEAKSFRKGFFRLYGRLFRWHSKQKGFANRNGYVINLIGRKRRLPAAMNHDRSYECMEAERQAVNSPIQGLASDMTVAAAIEINDCLNQVKVVGTVHDEILAEVREDLVDKVIPAIISVMEKPTILHKTFKLRLSVPIEAEAEVGPWN